MRHRSQTFHWNSILAAGDAKSEGANHLRAEITVKDFMRKRDISKQQHNSHLAPTPPPPTLANDTKLACSRRLVSSKRLLASPTLYRAALAPSASRAPPSPPPLARGCAGSGASGAMPTNRSCPGGRALAAAPPGAPLSLTSALGAPPPRTA